MTKINITAIIKSCELERGYVAKELFPGNKYPAMALTRLEQGKMVLDADQISRLSSITSIPIHALFTGGAWQARCRKGVHTFELEDFRAELDTKDWTTKLYHNKSLFHTEIFHKHGMTMSEYFEILDEQVNKFNINLKIEKHD